MGRRQRHHTVSRGYQRAFAECEQLLVIDKTTLQYVPAGTRDVFCHSDFSTWFGPEGPNDGLETEWRRLEDQWLPRFRRLGTSDEMPGDRNSVKVIGPLHIARSTGLEAAHAVITRQVTEQRAERLADDAELLRLWASDWGPPPPRSEVKAELKRRMMLSVATRILLLQSMTRLHNVALERFANLHVQLLHAAGGIDFVLGDNPCVVSNKSQTRLMSLGEIALGDANVFFMPVSRRVAATLSTSDEGDLRLAPFIVQRLNIVSWRAALRQVACHPSADPNRLLGETTSHEASDR